MNISQEILNLQAEIDTLNSYVTEVASGANEMWLLLTATFVFLMQAGFALVEAGKSLDSFALS